MAEIGRAELGKVEFNWPVFGVIEAPASGRAAMRI
jgi:hypothetical protein